MNKTYFRRITIAFQFLTIVPLPSFQDPVDEKDISGSSAFFPIVGLFQGLLLVAGFLIFRTLFPLEITTGLLLTLLVISNGGFHLDGLSDTFDALASRGNKEKMLGIMKDSTTGPIGVTSIIFIILLKFLVLYTILNSLPIPYYVPLLMLPVCGRWSMVPAIYHGRSARTEGLGKIYLNGTGSAEFMISALFVVLIAIMVSIVHMKSLSVENTLWLLVPFSGVYFFSLSSVLFFHKKIRGITGDILGAISEISEVLFLLLFFITIEEGNIF